MPLSVTFSLNSFCKKNSYVTRKMHILHSGQNLFTFIFGQFGIKHGKNQSNCTVGNFSTAFSETKAAATFSYWKLDESSNITVSTINEKAKKSPLPILSILLENNVFMRYFTFPFDQHCLQLTFLRLLFRFYLNPAWITVDTYLTNSL